MELEHTKQLAISILHEGDYSIVVLNQGQRYTSSKKGIAPILELIDTNINFFQHAYVADKVIGKAAALLLAFCGIKAIYAQIISEHAIKILQKYHIEYDYKEKVPYIINRTQTGMCPMESCVLEINDASEAVGVLKAAVIELRQKSQA